MLFIGNGKVITRDAEHPYFEKGAVVCDGKNRDFVPGIILLVDAVNKLTYYLFFVSGTYNYCIFVECLSLSEFFRYEKSENYIQCLIRIKCAEKQHNYITDFQQ